MAFCGDNSGFYAILSNVDKSGRLYAILKERKECVLNFPSVDTYKKYLKWKSEEDENAEDEISFEDARKVCAPRLKECFLNLECKYLWGHEVKEGKSEDWMGILIKHRKLRDTSFEYKERQRNSGDTLACIVLIIFIIFAIFALSNPK